jgi:hypothetical protein
MKINEIIEDYPHIIAKRELLDIVNSSEEGSEEYEDALMQLGILDDMWFNNTGHLNIFREMIVDKSFVKNAKPGDSLGIYWSHDAGSAHAFDADTVTHNRFRLTIHALLSPNDFSWEGIMSLHHVGEHEVRLSKGDELQIERIWIDGKEAHLKNWIGKGYRA